MKKLSNHPKQAQSLHCCAPIFKIIFILYIKATGILKIWELLDYAVIVASWLPALYLVLVQYVTLKVLEVYWKTIICNNMSVNESFLNLT
jgi:hypothetical protein